jgi:hypothetical protein
MLEIKFVTNYTKVKEFINQYHSYIKFADRPSRKMYWELYENDIMVGVFGLASAFARPKTIQDFMRENNIQFNELGNNIVYCLHGSQDKNVGTKFLKLIRKDAKIRWKERYGDELKAIQCFVLPPRNGAIYKADNWLQLGETTGGVTQIVRTLPKTDPRIETLPNVEKRTFKSGEIKYLYREFSVTDKKLIFMKLL